MVKFSPQSNKKPAGKPVAHKSLRYVSDHECPGGVKGSKYAGNFGTKKGDDFSGLTTVRKP